MTALADRYNDGRYLKAHPEWHADRSPWKAEQVLSIVRQLGFEPLTVCDVGCGTGLALAHVVRGLPSLRRAVGIEPSNDAPFHPKAEAVATLRRVPARELDEHFDLALMLDVFEHVPDYLGFLREARRLADRFVFHIPLEVNAASVVSGRLGNSRVSNGHLHHFTSRTALATLADCGYQVVRFTYTGSGWDGPGRSPNTPLNIVRRSLMRVSPLFNERILGGTSLLVVADTA